MEIRRQIGVRADEFRVLARKIADELQNPGQLFDPQRRLDLFHKGMSRLVGISHSQDFNIDSIHGKLQDTLVCTSTLDRLTFYIETQTPIHGIVFPDSSHIVYRPPFETEPEIVGKELKAEISATTNSSGKAEIESYPSDGYKTTAGEIVPFIARNPADYEQHGGFLVDNVTGNVEILDYWNFDELRKRDLHTGEYAIEANWYLDSDNYKSVTARTNLQRRDEFNGLGTLQFTNGEKKYFSVNTYREYYMLLKKLKLYTPYEHERYVSLRNIAVLCCEIAKTEGASRWSLGGLEYTSGGTRILMPGALGKNSFAVYT